MFCFKYNKHNQCWHLKGVKGFVAQVGEVHQTGWQNWSEDTPCAHVPCPVWWPSWQHRTPFGSGIPDCNAIQWNLRSGYSGFTHGNVKTTIDGRPRHWGKKWVYSLEVPEHVSSTEQHGCGVGNIPSHSLCKGVACTLKQRRESEAGKNDFICVD